MKKIFLLSLFFISELLFSQTFIQTYQDRVNQVSQTNINTNLQEFAALGVKTTGSVANTNALNWLKNKYLSYGYSDTEITEQSFTYNSATSKNLIITKTGTLYPNTYVIICGHYDTIVGPGVNDNGSGVSVILEIARILKNVNTQYSIKFINFSGEEQGLVGSQAYVDNVVNATNPKLSIKLVFNIDEVGGVSGQTNNTITCERDTSSPTSNNTTSNTMTQELINCVTLYSTLQTNLSYAYASDYMPFQANGDIITGFYEYNESSYPHTANDTYANMDPVYVYNVAKAATGATQHFTIADSTTLNVDDSNLQNLDSFKIYPNPADHDIFLEFNYRVKDYYFSISDLYGNILIKVKNQSQIDVSKLKPGVYLGTLSVNGSNTSEKIIIK